MTHVTNALYERLQCRPLATSGVYVLAVGGTSCATNVLVDVHRAVIGMSTAEHERLVTVYVEAQNIRAGAMRATPDSCCHHALLVKQPAVDVLQFRLNTAL